MWGGEHSGPATASISAPVSARPSISRVVAAGSAKENIRAGVIKLLGEGFLVFTLQNGGRICSCILSANEKIFFGADTHSCSFAVAHFPTAAVFSHGSGGCLQGAGLGFWPIKLCARFHHSVALTTSGNPLFVFFLCLHLIQRKWVRRPGPARARSGPSLMPVLVPSFWGSFRVLEPTVVRVMVPFLAVFPIPF